MTVFVNVISSAILGVLVGFFVAETGGPLWAACGFGAVTYFVTLRPVKK